jgi:propionyl-CoA carboxylase alpha chain
MIAKLVTHAPTRAGAIDAMSEALDAFTIEGVRHNIPFLASLMQHPRWKEGRLSTGFIAEEYPDGFHASAPEGETASRLAAVAAAMDHVLGERKRRISGQMIGRAVTREKRRLVRLDGSDVGLDIMRQGDAVAVRFVKSGKADTKTHVLQSHWKPGDQIWSGTYDGKEIAVQVRAIRNGFSLACRGVETKAHVYTEAEATLAKLMPEKKASDSGKALLCPMPGLVVSIAVKEGQEVKAGEPLAIVEAMKMENVLRAERDAAVKKVHVKPGDSLAVDAVILEFA